MFSLILPVHNESGTLVKCVESVRKAFSKIGVAYEIIIAEDGSTDDTAKIGRQLSRKYHNVTFIHHSKKLGRGRAVTLASQYAKGSTIGFIDTDMATSASFLGDLVKYSSKYDVVTGSRYVPGASFTRPFLREKVSRAYNMLIRFALGIELYDSQCGFKAFSRDFVEREFPKINEHTWAWDAVVLVHAIKKGYSFKEFPVTWVEHKSAAHSNSLKRIMSDVKIHGRVVITMFLNWRLNMGISEIEKRNRAYDAEWKECRWL